MQDFLRINAKDNVAVALRDVAAGTRLAAGMYPAAGAAERAGAAAEPRGEKARTVAESGAEKAGAAAKLGAERAGSAAACAAKAAAAVAECGIAGASVTAREDIPAGHKMALRRIPKGGTVVKYGYPIGIAKEDIEAGAWVHTHNIRTGLGDVLEYVYRPEEAGSREPEGEGKGHGTACKTAAEGRDVPGREAAVGSAFFQGFLRPDGRAGVRNEIWIIPTVGCVNNVASAIARQASGLVRGSVEEVIAFPHPYGCSQMGEDQENTRKILADLIRHPNAGGVLVLGLGCENSGIHTLKPYLGEYDERRVKFLVAQECEDEVEEALKLVEELIAYAASFERQPIGMDKLVVGLKCGGSDGFSGITANPLVGRFSDRLISQGGTAILTEVPEMFGAETILMNRCENRELFDKTVRLINDFKTYFKSHNQTIYENPSPGNKAGGISTLEDKSLGCTQKSGSAAVRGVLQYGERVQGRGLHLLSAPGNDLVAATALAAAGAQIVLFTTGRGTPFASPVPTVKISTNSGLAARKSGWIDFDAGGLAEQADWAEETERLYSYVCQVASGRKVRSEEAGYHDMAIFKQGVTL